MRVDAHVIYERSHNTKLRATLYGIWKVLNYRRLAAQLIFLGVIWNDLAIESNERLVVFAKQLHGSKFVRTESFPREK
jgi:hypothetical protein